MTRSRTHPVENSEAALPTIPWGVGISRVTQTSANSPDSGQGIQSDCVTFGGSAPPDLARLHQPPHSHNGTPQGPTAVLQGLGEVTWGPSAMGRWVALSVGLGGAL